jgi:hypothetical protein
LGRLGCGRRGGHCEQVHPAGAELHDEQVGMTPGVTRER